MESLQRHLKQKSLEAVAQELQLHERSWSKLSLDHLVASRFREESSSATTAQYSYLFEFQDQLGKAFEFRRVLTRGDGREVSERVTTQVRCDVTWNLFKGKAVKSKINFTLTQANKR
jgi:hypothetical protein